MVGNMALGPLLSVGSQLWLLLLLAGFIGWGRLGLRALGAPLSSLAIEGCVGLALMLAAGGLLNLAQLILPGVMIALALIGVVLAFVPRPAGTRAPEEIAQLLALWRWRRVVVLLLALLFLFRVASSTRVWHFVPTDDENIYLALPVKMMDTHQYAADPFSARRIESSIGGSYFLQCFVLSALPIEHIQMMDRDLGFLLLVLGLLALARHFGLSPPAAAWLVALGTAMTPMDYNITFSVMPSALVLALVWVAARPGDFSGGPFAQAFVTGLLAGALCILKSVYLPFAGLFCLVLGAAMGPGRGWKAALTGWVTIFAGTLAVMGLWMIAMRLTSGTGMYPILGSGYDFSAYHQFPMPFTAQPLRVLREGAAYYVPLSVIVLTQLFLLRRERSFVLLVTTAACLIAAAVTSFGTGGDNTQRYYAALVTPVFLLGFLQLSRELAQRPGWLPGQAIRGGIAALLLAWMALHALRGQYTTMLREIEYAWSGAANFPPQQREAYARLRAALPPDGRILTTLQAPFLLAPLDERILFADYPGCASPPPGWPIRQDGEALAQFLLSQSVRYLAYTYTDNAQLDFARSVDIPAMDLRSQIQMKSFLLADAQYRELRRSRKVLYDDGTVFILDLATSSNTPAP